MGERFLWQKEPMGHILSYFLYIEKRVHIAVYPTLAKKKNNF
jgi:hypothetical protein